ncbi:LysM peptidoglycan-binding domain-containing protein [Arthrobacter sp. E3]|uniref:LysM peptidoglycan-binding domain-containing protein n=1 Tax=Arthrobacter sp. E3 TaxID=517402 RepID=UPI001A950A2E|nr:LysM peptidoglycan-binding domain-containing protein [Arthrobacter sp. E3]
MTQSQLLTSGSKKLVAVATAAIPVVILSSLVLAHPAAAVQAYAAGNSIPAAMVASSLPRSIMATGGAVKAFLKAQPVGAITHTVVAGDTVSAIAARFGVSTDSVLSANNLTASTLIHPGKVLKISGAAAGQGAAPAAPSSEANYTVRTGDTLGGIAAQHNISLATIFSLNGLSGSSVIHPGQSVKVGGKAAAASPSASSEQVQNTGGGGKYVIRAGDTLSAIAAKHNVSLSSLLVANGADPKTTIYPGKTLSIPGVNAASSSVTAIAPVAEAPALRADQRVPSTFLHYTYPDAVVNDADRNKAALLAAPSPSRSQMQQLVASTATSMGVDPALAMAFAQQESGFNHQSVSPANAIGTMQVIPSAGEWASGLVGRQLNLLDPQDNVTAGVAIIRALHRGAASEDIAIAGYYQGQYSVSIYGMFGDTVNYVAGIKANRELFR